MEIFHLSLAYTQSHSLLIFENHIGRSIWLIYLNRAELWWDERTQRRTERTSTTWKNTCILTKSIRIISDSLTALHPPPDEPHTQLVHVTCYMPHMSTENCVYIFWLLYPSILPMLAKKKEVSTTSIFFFYDENNMSITRHYINIQLAPSGIHCCCGGDERRKANWTSIKSFSAHRACDTLSVRFDWCFECGRKNFHRKQSNAIESEGEE